MYFVVLIWSNLHVIITSLDLKQKQESGWDDPFDSKQTNKQANKQKTHMEKIKKGIYSKKFLTKIYQQLRLAGELLEQYTHHLTSTGLIFITKEMNTITRKSMSKISNTAKFQSCWPNTCQIKKLVWKSSWMWLYHSFVSFFNFLSFHIHSGDMLVKCSTLCWYLAVSFEWTITSWPYVLQI